MNKIYTRLKKLKKMQLERICRKMKCRTGTKSIMISHLIRPIQMRYKMSDSEDDYIYSETDDDYFSDSSESDQETTYPPVKKKSSKKTSINLTKIPTKFDDQLSELLLLNAKSDKTRQKQPFTYYELKQFLNEIRDTKNRHIIENAYNKLKSYLLGYRSTGGHTGSVIANIIGIAKDEYNEKQDRSREIVERSLKKYYKKHKKRKKKEEEKMKPMDRKTRADFFSKKYEKLFNKK